METDEEMRCEWCREWSPVSQWDECEVACEDCGSHSGVKCPHCGACFDSTVSSWGVDNLERRPLPPPPQPGEGEQR